MKSRKHAVLAVCLAAVFLPSASCAAERSPDYWPTEGWRVSAPEEQGMDSERLADMIGEIHEKDRHIRSVVVIRNGYLVLDACFHPYPKDTRHIIHSCTKTITSTLIGIAIDKGYIEGVDQTVLSLFPERTPGNPDPRKESMTVEHLLTMSTGLECRDSYLYDWQGLGEMTRAWDWVQYVLDLPILYTPGERFEYCNGASYLLSVILQDATGTTALAFAKEHLFGSLGIEDVSWQMNRFGVNLGWGGIDMRPKDLARIAFLFLNEGKWDGEQIVSSEWIDAATSAHIRAGTLSDSYGYQIWPNEMGDYMMLGYGGQHVIVHPGKNLIAVFASCLPSSEFFVPRALYETSILPAAESSRPLPPNEAGTARLRAVTETIANPEPEPVPPFPETAAGITGKQYVFDDNPIGFNWISLKFDPAADEAWLHLSYGGKIIQADVGLDGVYRLSRGAGRLRAYRGRWESDNVFMIEYEVVDHTERGSARLEFDGDVLTMRVRGVIAGVEHEVTGRIREPKSNHLRDEP